MENEYWKIYFYITLDQYSVTIAVCCLGIINK